MEHADYFEKMPVDACEAILELLEDCGEIPEETKERILKEKNTKRLGMWLKLAAKSESIEEFRIAM